MALKTLAWVLGAYAIGTLPSPWLIARAAGRHDVIAEMTRQDSPGDAHFLVTKRISTGLGVGSIVADLLKGFLPALAARLSHQPASTLALVAVAAVAGHSFAPYLRSVGGRGLTTAAGVSFALVPLAMLIAGGISAIGMALKAGGLGTSIGFGSLPLVTAILGYPAVFVAMSGALVALIALRRLEGISEDRRAGIRLASALTSRLVFDLPRGQHSSRPETAS